MNKYYNATIWINNNKPMSMILTGKNKKITKTYITNFYIKLNKIFHNINSFKVKLDRVYFIKGKYITEEEFNNL